MLLSFSFLVCSGAFLYGIGPVDAQCCLLDFMLELSYALVEIGDSISLTEAVALIVHQHIVGQEHLMCQSASETSVSARHCFGGLYSNILRPGDSKLLVGEANRDSLMSSLLKLVNLLLTICIQPPNRIPTTQHRVRPEPVSSMNMAPFCGKSDEEKCSETDEQKTETAANNRTRASTYQPVSCSHYIDSRYPEDKPVTLCDMVLAHPNIIKHLLHSLATCNNNMMPSMVTNNAMSSTNDMFNSIDPYSVGDGVFQILCTLNSNATDLKLILTPLLQYLRGENMAGPTTMMSLLSEPLLWFILRVLDCESTLRIFLSMGMYCEVSLHIYIYIYCILLICYE